MSNAIDLHSCPPDELAGWLLFNRFDNNAVDTASFLLQCTSTLPNAAEISAQLMGGENEEDEIEDDAPAVNHILQSPPLPPFITKELASIGIEVSCTNPRGRFIMKLHKTGIALSNQKQEELVTIPSSSVENLIWFRKGEEYKKMKSSSGKKKPLPGHMVLICFKQDAKVMFRSKGLNQVCLQLPSYAEGGETEGQFTEKQWWDGLQTALCSGNNNMVRVHSKMDHFTLENTECFTFQSEGASGSSTTTEGMPYVGCYHGLNDGVLYPLREGLLFFKPPLYVPRSKLTSISCGRGSGSASRYVDMAIQVDTEESIEFTNIAREELSVLNDYIHRTLIPAMQADADGNCSDDDGAVAVEVVRSDVCNDSEEDGETESTGVKRVRPLRAASRTAREATRAHFDQGANHSESSDEEDFQSDDSSGSDSDNTERNTDEEAVGSSDEEEELATDEEADTDVRHTKKPRVSTDSETTEH